MKKKALAIAIGAALTLPVVAQAQTSVTVYGKLYPQIIDSRVYGATAPGTAGLSTLTRAPTAAAVAASNREAWVMESANSRIGFRGVEDLGAGLKAIFQLEGGFGVDSGNLNTANQLWSLDTYVGLSSDAFGTVKLGNIDSVYKSLGDRLSFPRGLASGNAPSLSNILSIGKFGAGSNVARFHERFQNNIRYESPEIAGFQLLGNFALSEQPNDFHTGSAWAVGGKWENGPFYVALAHERHNNFFAGSTNLGATAAGITAALAAGRESKDNATRLTGQYRITPTTRVEANVARLQYKESGPIPAGTTLNFREYKTTTWALSAEQIFGPFTLAASYGQAREGDCQLVAVACSTSGLGGKMAILGGTYALSKRTALFTYATHVRNEDASNYSNVARNNVGAVAVGSNITQFAVGVDHSF